MSSITLPSADDIAKIAGRPVAVASSAKPIRRRFSVRTPAGKRSSTWIPVVHKQDPRQALLDKIGDIPDGIVFGCRILIAIYVPPIVTKTEGGIHIAPSLQEEDVDESLWQGKSALVVAMGPDAFVDTDEVKFKQRVQVGDWVWSRASEGLSCDVNEVPCRVLESERYIIGKLPHPDMVA
jgi:co-chaperonin GroES (HSP10)